MPGIKLKHYCMLLILLVQIGYAANTMNESSIFVGIEPKFAKEDWYAEDELNINILPFVIEKPLRDKYALKLSTNFYLLTGRPTGAEVSLVGIGLGAYYYPDQSGENIPRSGLFFGPAIIISHDFDQDMQHYTATAEAGYALEVAPDIVLHFSLQEGVSFFTKEDKDTANHFGFFFNAGMWF